MDLTQRMDTELVAGYEEVPVEGLINWDDLSVRPFVGTMTVTSTSR